MPLPTDFSPLPEGEPPAPERVTQDASVSPHTVSPMQLHRTNRAVNNLNIKHDLFAAKVDSAFPGGDYKTHYNHHADIIEREIESKKLWRDVRKALLISGISLLAGAILVGLWNYLKYGGLLK